MISKIGFWKFKSYRLRAVYIQKHSFSNIHGLKFFFDLSMDENAYNWHSKEPEKVESQVKDSESQRILKWISSGNPVLFLGLLCNTLCPSLFPIILMGERELATLLSLSSFCLKGVWLMTNEIMMYHLLRL